MDADGRPRENFNATIPAVMMDVFNGWMVEARAHYEATNGPDVRPGWLICRLIKFAQSNGFNPTK